MGSIDAFDFDGRIECFRLDIEPFPVARFVAATRRWERNDGDERMINALHAATRALGERGNSLLKTTFKALRRVTVCPWRTGAVTAAAVVLLHHEHGRTT